MSVDRLKEQYRIAPKGQRETALKRLQCATNAALRAHVSAMATPNRARRTVKRCCTVMPCSCRAIASPTQTAGSYTGKARTARAGDGNFQPTETNDAAGNL